MSLRFFESQLLQNLDDPANDLLRKPNKSYIFYQVIHRKAVTQ